jgi:methylated-DNA-[protein]-cysteine S-methyltransferase
MPEFVGYYQCPIGTIVIKANSEGVISCSIMNKEVDTPTPSTSSIIIDNAIQQFDEYFHKKRKQFNLPLQMKGTAFQVAVWKAVAEVPYGKTASYSDIASKVDSVGSVRAVGAANGKNPLWIIVPCHRIVGADGSLTGYAGGLWRKKWLLEHEGALNQLPF